jgi:hypothetical protein
MGGSKIRFSGTFTILIFVGGDSDDGTGNKKLAIYKQTRSHSRAIKEAEESDHKKLESLAGRSVKKSQG